MTLMKGPLDEIFKVSVKWVSTINLPGTDVFFVDM